jgi:hypothetical protein
MTRPPEETQVRRLLEQIRTRVAELRHLEQPAPTEASCCKGSAGSRDCNGVNLRLTDDRTPHLSPSQKQSNPEEVLELT